MARGAALKLEQALDIGLIVPLDPFSYSEKLSTIREMFDSVEGMKRDVLQHLDSLGLEIIPTIACPFDALAKDRGEVFLVTRNGVPVGELRPAPRRGFVAAEVRAAFRRAPALDRERLRRDVDVLVDQDPTPRG